MNRWFPVLAGVIACALSASASAVPGLAADGPRTRLLDASYQVEGVAAGPIELVFPRVDLQPVDTDGRSFLQVAMAGCGLVDRPGAPELPSFSRLVQIPDHSGVRFELVDEEFEYIELDRPLYPQQDRMHDTRSELPLPFLENGDWLQGETFPAASLVQDEPALLRNTRVVKLTAFPVQVVDGGRRLKVYSRMVVRPVFEGVNPVNARQYTVGNPDGPLGRLVAPLLLNRPDQAADGQRDIFDNNPEPGTYLIIARNATITNDPYFIQFVDWKRQKGHKVYIAGETQIGGWTNSAILNYTINAYQTWADTPDFLLLIGDTGSSTAYEVPGGAGDSYSGQQDHYYSRLEGNDILGDIAVGRVSVTNSTQLAIVLNKIMLYERTPGSVGNTNWLASGAVSTGYDANSMIQQSRTIAQGMAARGFTDIDSSWYPNTGTTWVEQAFNSDINFYNYRGWIGMNGVNASWVDTHFSNVGTPVVTVIFTCATGDFNGGYSTTEAFLRNGSVPSPKGGVCALGFSTANTHTAYNNAVVGGFWNGVLEYEFPEVGVSLFMGKTTLYLTMPPGDSNPENFANWANLMGDPGMYLWLGQPATLAASHAASITTGQSHLAVTVTSGGQPLANAVVCATQSSTGFQSRVLTDANGVASLPITGVGSGTVKLTVSRENHLVYQADLSQSAASAYASVNAPGIGGDGLAAPGESVVLLPVLQNTGTSTTLTGLTATVSVPAQYGTLSDNTLAWPNVGAGSSAAATGSCTLVPAAGLAHGTVIPLSLSISSGQGSFSDILEVPVSAPYLVNTALAFLPGGSSLTPGTSASVTVTLNNGGGLAASSMAYVLSSSDPLVTVTSGNAAGGALPVGGNASPVFTVAVSSGAFGGYQATLQLAWTANGVIQGSMPLVFPVGTPVAENPTGPDSYGYRVYEDTDSNTESPVYNWIPLAPAEGGSGTLLGVNDTADEGDDAVRVTLPFTFRYYGVDHTYLAVCSNGFAAFGENAHDETDFRNHPFPSGLGPDNMLGVMWDDMLTGSGAAVYGQYFPAQHIYVVEWYSMRFNNDNGSRNTFQLILYDPAFHPTATGDGEIVYQYQDFNNNQSHSYDFPYCSIGFKNGNSTDGLTISNYNLRPATIAGINDGKALKITTDLGLYSDSDIVPPVIAHTPPPISYAGQGIALSASLTDNHGISGGTLHWNNGSGEVVQALSSLGGDLWGATIPAQGSGTVIDYFFTAVDVSENSNQSTSATFTISVYDILFEDGFEGTTLFTHAPFGGGVDEWHSESARAHTGGLSMKFGGTGNGDYSPGGAGWLTSPSLAIPAEATDLRLSFWSWIAGETSGLYPDSCYDGGVVEISLDGGAWQEALLTPAYTHALRERSVVALDFPRLMLSGSADWTQYALDVPEGTQEVQVRFGFVSDNGTHREGWYVDELRLTGQLPPSTDPVTDLQIYTTQNSTVLTWTPINGALAYRVYQSDNAYSFAGPHVAEVTDPLWITTLPLNTRRYFHVTVVR